MGGNGFSLLESLNASAGAGLPCRYGAVLSHDLSIFAAFAGERT
jgi:hypothetical protein